LAQFVPGLWFLVTGNRSNNSDFLVISQRHETSDQRPEVFYILEINYIDLVTVHDTNISIQDFRSKSIEVKHILFEIKYNLSTRITGGTYDSTAKADRA
jgi:hypothetical protein